LISSEPEIENRILAKAIIRDYVSMHEKLNHQAYLDNTTLFANSLEEYPKIFSILQKTIGSLIERFDNSMQSTFDDLKKNFFFSVSGLDHFFLLDLGLFLEAVFNNAVLTPSDRKLYDDYLKLKNSVVIAGHIGQEFLKSDLQGPKKYGHSGSSMFFPPDKKFSSARRISWCQYISHQLTSPFQEASLWDEFIDKINVPVISPV
jgi:hypothetical protein